jgi:hypothetical protein
MMKLTKNDLAGMNRVYLESLDRDNLADVVYELRNAVVELLEHSEKDSRNSSRPPSSDNPYEKDNDRGEESSSTDSTENGNEDKPVRLRTSRMLTYRQSFFLSGLSR